MTQTNGQRLRTERQNLVCIKHQQLQDCLRLAKEGDVPGASAAARAAQYWRDQLSLFDASHSLGDMYDLS